MIMEVDKIHQESSTKSPAIATVFGQQPAPNVCGTDGGKEQTGQDENEIDSDSGSMTCPLFMEGLPSDFATNPQLAAIASLLNDDVREESEETNNTQDENDAATHNKNSNNVVSSHNHSTQSPPQIALPRHLKHVEKSRNRRRKQRASPYPRPNDRKNENQAATKSSSVGEITLFMNMWKP